MKEEEEKLTLTHIAMNSKRNHNKKNYTKLTISIKNKSKIPLPQSIDTLIILVFAHLSLVFVPCKVITEKVHFIAIKKRFKRTYVYICYSLCDDGK